MVLRVPHQQDMPCLRMYQTVQQAPVDVDTHTHAGSHRHIDGALHPLSRPPGHFPKNRSVYIRVKSHRHTQSILESSHHIAVLPALLGRPGDIAVSLRLPVQVKGTETPNAQSLDIPSFKVADQLSKSLPGLPGGVGLPVQYGSVLIPDSTDHLCAAGFNASD